LISSRVDIAVAAEVSSVLASTDFNGHVLPSASCRRSNSARKASMSCWLPFTKGQSTSRLKSDVSTSIPYLDEKNAIDYVEHIKDRSH
jgi:hypothetical protein